MFTRRFDDGDEPKKWDSQPIRLDPFLSQEGIAASLRRAFGAGALQAVNDRDFDDLIAQLR